MSVDVIVERLGVKKDGIYDWIVTHNTEVGVRVRRDDADETSSKKVAREDDR